MQLKASKLLEDVRAAADLIVRFTEGKSPADYAGDPLLRSGVERQFLIIGEAMSQLARLAPEVAAQITYSRRIIAFRNVLVHGYDLVDHDVVWDVIETHLPVLRRQVASLLAEP
jgi:uncharacterized protein with HEPN domain